MSTNVGPFIVTNLNSITESDRIPFFKNTLCKNYDLTLTTPAAARQKFGLGKGEIDRSNAVTGECEGYEFCLCEYYHRGSGKHDSHKWQVAVSVKMKEKAFPEFKLIQKTYSDKVFLAIMLLPFIVLLLAGFVMSLRAFPEGILFTLLTGGVSFLLCKIYFKNLKEIYHFISQGKYNISNNEFKKKFAIVDASDVNNDKKYFTPKTCAKILAFIPKINKLVSKGNCLHFLADHTQLSEDNLESLVENYINQAKIFDSNIDLDTPYMSRKKYFEEKICSDYELILSNDFKTLSNKFGLNLQTRANLYKPEQANALIGNYEGHEYCIFEYYYQNNTNLVWNKTIAFGLKPKNNLTFSLVSDYGDGLKSFRQGITCGLLFFAPWVIIPSIFILNAKNIYEIIPILLFMIIPLSFFGGIGIKLLKARSSLKKGIAVFKTLKSSGFADKYSFMDFKDEDINKIKKIMTPKVCEKIVKHEPKITDLQCLNGYLHFTQEGQVTADNLENFVENALIHAKLFEED